MDIQLEKILEALLFASDEPLTLRRLREILKPETAPAGDATQAAAEEAAPQPSAAAANASAAEDSGDQSDFDGRIMKALETVKAKYADSGSPVVILEVAEGWQFATNPKYAVWVKKLYKNKTSFRLSQAAMETLAIIAYRQPITRAEIEEIRGVEAIAALETLLERNFIRTAGRKETVGRPILYATTPEFMRQFGLNTLKDLPVLEEPPASSAGHESGPQTQETIRTPNNEQN
ncbi:MAG: SMC-Scp complex subunit ScpB [Elusimicrobia bacterium]|nr:SMC-Scp complex subunit ScpB [Elusimicrobiota bacterium]